LAGQQYFVAGVAWLARRTWHATRTVAVTVTPGTGTDEASAEIEDPDTVTSSGRSTRSLKAPSSARKKRSKKVADDEAEKADRPEEAAEPEPAPREPVPVSGLSSKVEDEQPEDQDDVPEQPEEDDIPSISDRARAIFKRHKSKKKVEFEAETGLEDKIAPARRANPSRYTCPGVELLDEPEGEKGGPGEDFFQQQAARLEQSLNDFNIEARVVNIETGPVVTFYELELAPGIKVNKVTALSDDISMVLKAHSVRVVAPIPGKSTVGIEVPNVDKELVRLRDVMTAGRSAVSKYQIPLFLGKDSQGAPLVLDLAKMPHLLIAGRTGSGKSVCINSLILSVLMTRTPDDVKMILIDPKTVELTPYRQIPHLLSPVVTNMKKAAGVLEWAEQKMDQRFEFLSKAGVRQLSEYNALGENEIRRRLGVDDPEQAVHIPYHMPYIVIIIDELADLMMVGAKDVEHSITRLAQKSRAVGIHVVLATQRPSVDVITGLIKSNLPARISFQVSSKVDSRTILDANGADKLVGSGDMLVLKPGAAKLTRAQGTYVADAEIERVTGAVQDIVPEFNDDLVQVEKTGGLKMDSNPSDRDDLFEDALRVVLESQRGSVSLLQRRLGIGYTRAARLVELIAEEGYLGEHKGSQAREVLITLEEWEALKAENAETPAGASQE
ncbi:MAG: DNA translocase FtsK, partial [Planctomycetota bacterium]